MTNYISNLQVNIINRIKRIQDVSELSELYRIANRSDWDKQVDLYLQNKVRVDAASASGSSDNQTIRCVNYIYNHGDDAIIQFFVGNLTFKPAGINTVVQLSHLTNTEWRSHRDEVFNILNTVKTMSSKERSLYTTENNREVKCTPLHIIESMLNDKLGLSLFDSSSVYYNGSHRKKVHSYDAASVMANETKSA